MNDKERVALGSIAASAGLTAAKAVVGLLTGSLAILSEAGHSLIDLVGDGADLFRGARSPASRPTTNINTATARSRASPRLPKRRCCSCSRPS